VKGCAGEQQRSVFVVMDVDATFVVSAHRRPRWRTLTSLHRAVPGRGSDAQRSTDRVGARRVATLAHLDERRASLAGLGIRWRRALFTDVQHLPARAPSPACIKLQVRSPIRTAGMAGNAIGSSSTDEGNETCRPNERAKNNVAALVACHCNPTAR
jgi:hypothetical protein